MSGAEGGAFRFLLAAPASGAAPDEQLGSALGEVSASWITAASGAITLWVGAADAPATGRALERAGFVVLTAVEEPPRDWLAEAAALQRPVAVGSLVLDPHEGPQAADAPGRRRLFVPAESAFGTGSHESTRLALRLLLGLRLTGLSVIDVGCGAGTLGLAARCAGAARVVGLDIDPDAAVASGRNAARNAVTGCAFLAAPLAALGCGGFDVAVANMLEEELAPVLQELARLLNEGGLLVTAGQLLSRQTAFLDRLREAGFSPSRLAAESEWLGTVSVRR